MIDVVLSPSWERVQAGLAAAVASQPTRLAATGQRALDILMGSLQREAPEGETGTLRANMMPHLEVGNPTTAYATNETPYRRYVLSGHGDIYPVRAKALRWESAGGVVFAKHVRPVPPNDYPARARADAIPEMTLLIQEHAYTLRQEILG